MKKSRRIGWNFFYMGGFVLLSMAIPLQVLASWIDPVADEYTVCSTGNGNPPFLGTAIDPNLLIILDNSGSMYDLAYVENIGECFDDSYNNSTIYAGYFDKDTVYKYDLTAKSYVADLTTTNPLDICTPASVDYGKADVVCVGGNDTDLDGKLNVITHFGATGNFLNWMAASKFDIEKKILTGGKYDSDVDGNNLTSDASLIMESRGCTNRRFVKEIALDDTALNAQNQLENLILTLSIRPPEEEIIDRWDSTISYSVGDKVVANGRFYISAVNGNLNIKPDSTADVGHWNDYYLNRWYPNVNYPAGSIVLDVASGNMYRTKSGGISSPDALELAYDTAVEWELYNLTHIDIYPVTLGGFNQDPCLLALQELESLDGTADDSTVGADGKTRLGRLKDYTEECMGYDQGGNPNTIEGYKKAAFNHSMQECWYYNKFGHFQPGGGTVSAIKNACEGLYESIDPAELTAWDNSYICSGQYGISPPDRYVGRCWEPAGTIVCTSLPCDSKHAAGDYWYEPSTKVYMHCTTASTLEQCSDFTVSGSGNNKTYSCNTTFSPVQDCVVTGEVTTDWTNDNFKFYDNCIYDECAVNTCVKTACPTATAAGGAACVYDPTFDDPDDPENPPYCYNGWPTTTFYRDTTAGKENWWAYDDATLSSQGENGYYCVDQAIRDFCKFIQIPEVIDPTDSTGLTGEVWNAPAMLVDSGIIGQLGKPIMSMLGYLRVDVPPEGVIQSVSDALRIGVMTFNHNGAKTECASYSTYLTDPINYECPEDNQDGAKLVAYIDQGVQHTQEVVSSINDIKAIAWTPLAEAMYNAIGYFAQKDGSDAMRLSDENPSTFPKDYLIESEISASAWVNGGTYAINDVVTDALANRYVALSAGTSSGTSPSDDTGVDWLSIPKYSVDPVQYWCQSNNILVITEGASTADVNDTVKSFVTNRTMDGDQASDAGCTDGLYGSTFMDDFTYYGYKSEPSTLYKNPKINALDEDEKQTISTYIVSTGTLRDAGVDECNPKIMMEEAAANGRFTEPGTSPLLQANTAEKLAQMLTFVFSEIMNRASAGSAASVISSSRGGEGAVYQAIFWPEQDRGLGTDSKLKWAGDVHSLFLGTGGILYEDTPDEFGYQDAMFFTQDTNGNGILDPAEDLNGDGILAPTEDLNCNGVLDLGEDLNCNGVIDFYTEDTNNDGLLEPTEDLNCNGILDVALSEDTNGNGLLDDGEDLNGNGALDLALNEDTNGNGVLDLGEDLNCNGVLDVSSEDINGDGILDPSEDYHDPPIPGISCNGQLDLGEDLNCNGKLDPSEDKDGSGKIYDRAVTVYYDEELKESRVCYRFEPSYTKNECVDSESYNILKANYIWSVNKWLASLSDADLDDNRQVDPTTGKWDFTYPRRYIFTWNDLDNDGIVDKTSLGDTYDEVLPFTVDLSSSTPPNYSYPLIDFGKPADWGNLVVDTSRGSAVKDFALADPMPLSATDTDYEADMVKNLIAWIRGQEQYNDELDDIDLDTYPDDTNGNGRQDFAMRNRLYNTGTIEFPLATPWRMGDIIHSTPTLVAKPAEYYDLLYKDKSYLQFAGKYNNRRNVVYFGANDGMMHAVNAGFYDETIKGFLKCPPEDRTFGICDPAIPYAELGEELWAYVPYNLLPHLKCLSDINYIHKYYVDAPPRIFDVQIFEDDCTYTTNIDGSKTIDCSDAIHPGGWGTIMVGYMRFGGAPVDMQDVNLVADNRRMQSTYFILDITDPERPPELLGEMTRNTDFNAYATLGYTTPMPTLVPMHQGLGLTGPFGGSTLWYLVMGNGPTSLKGENRDLHAKLAILPLEWLQGKIDPADHQSYMTTTREPFRIPKTVPSATSGPNLGGTIDLHTFVNSSGVTINFPTSRAFVSDLITMDYDLGGSAPKSNEYKADAVYFGTVEGEDFDTTSTGTTEWDTTYGGGRIVRLVTRKLDTDDSQLPTIPKDWEVKEFMNVGRPIVGAPSVGYDGQNFWVYFGTGRFFDPDDKTDAKSQYFFGVKEPKAYNASQLSFDWRKISEWYTWNPYTKVTYPKPNMNPGYQGLVRADQILVTEKNSSLNGVSELWCESGGTLDRTCLTSQGIYFTTFNELKTFIVGEPPYAAGSDDTIGVDGWYRVLTEPRERNLSQATLLGGLVTFSSYQPYDDACKAEGLGYLFGVYYQTGTAWNESIFGLDDSIDRNYKFVKASVSTGVGQVGTPSLYTGDPPTGDAKAFVQTSTGEILSISQENLPYKNYKTGRSSWLHLDTQTNE